MLCVCVCGSDKLSAVCSVPKVDDVASPHVLFQVEGN